MPNGGYTKRAIEEYDCKFKDVDDRLKCIETKIDKLSDKVSWIYGGASALGAVAGLLVNVLLKLFVNK